MTSIKLMRHLLGAVFAAAVLTACSSSKPAEIARKANIDFGVAIKAGDVLDQKTSKFIAANFNMIVPEDTMKWRNLRPTKDFWNWSDLDNMVKYAEKNRIKIKGHVFLWHEQNPGYVNTKKSREEAIALMEEQITTVMSRYRGKIQEYEIVNEMLNEDGSMRETPWYKNIGPDYIDLAFHTARKADPDAVLIINDFNNEYMGTAKGDSCYELVKGMKQRGVPIDAVGFQLHLIANPLDREAFINNIRRYHELGIAVKFTELDVRIKNPVTPEKEKIQLDIYMDIMKAALNEKNTASIIFWGYTDRLSWVPRFFGGYGSACPFDKNDKPKPVFKEMVELMRKHK